MARSRRRDRVVVGTAMGGRQYYRPSGTLPHSTDRDLGRSGTLRPYADTLFLHPGVPGVYPARPVRFVVHSSVVVRKGPRPTKPMLGPLSRSYFLTGDLPSRVRFCVQRKQRREVLFAYRKAGYSGSGRGRWNGFRRSYRRFASSGYAC